jgi:hypothetical protein
MDCMRASWAAHICRIIAFRLVSFPCTRAKERRSADGTFNLTAVAAIDAFSGRCGGRNRVGSALALFVRFIGPATSDVAAVSAAALDAVLDVSKVGETLIACVPAARGDPMAAK